MSILWSALFACHDFCTQTNVRCLGQTKKEGWWQNRRRNKIALVLNLRGSSFLFKLTLCNLAACMRNAHNSKDNFCLAYISGTWLVIVVVWSGGVAGLFESKTRPSLGFGWALKGRLKYQVSKNFLFDPNSMWNCIQIQIILFAKSKIFYYAV